MLVDSVTLIIKAGKGGDGKNSFSRTKQTARGGPDGGNGGHGGSVLAQGSHNAFDLGQFRFRKVIKGENGEHGSYRNSSGKNAKDVVLKVPIGTKITETQTGVSYEIVDEEPIVLVKGGYGGKGNAEFKSSTNQSPTYAQIGGPGEEKEFHFNLRLIADIGLIGLPNAGKSSLLAELTNSNPVIANYPFTTLNPNIGMLGTHPIADIPGLIEGAADGKGLGIKFLKHIEKTKILVHCIDLTGNDLIGAYKTVREEFKKFNPELLEKREILVLNKADLVDQDVIDKAVRDFNKMGLTALVCSIHDVDSLETLRTTLLDVIGR